MRIDVECGVLDVDGNIIPGLFAAGEMVGGLFYFNYPGGLGLTSAVLFGRIAGTSAANCAEGNMRQKAQVSAERPWRAVQAGDSIDGLIVHVSWSTMGAAYEKPGFTAILRLYAR